MKLPLKAFHHPRRTETAAEDQYFELESEAEALQDKLAEIEAERES